MHAGIEGSRQEARRAARSASYPAFSRASASSRNRFSSSVKNAFHPRRKSSDDTRKPRSIKKLNVRLPGRPRSSSVPARGRRDSKGILSARSKRASIRVFPVRARPLWRKSAYRMFASVRLNVAGAETPGSFPLPIPSPCFIQETHCQSAAVPGAQGRRLRTLARAATEVLISVLLFVCLPASTLPRSSAPSSMARLPFALLRLTCRCSTVAPYRPVTFLRFFPARLPRARARPPSHVRLVQSSRSCLS